MKAGEKDRVGTLRLIKAAIKSADIDARRSGKDKVDDGGHPRAAAEDDQAAPEFDRAVYVAGGRPELADKEARRDHGHREPTCQSRWTRPRRKAAIAAAIAEVGAASPKDMGKVMAALKARYAGQMDFGKASAAGEGAAEVAASHGRPPADRAARSAPVHMRESGVRATPPERQNRRESQSVLLTFVVRSPMRFPPHFLDEIRARLPVSQVVGRKVALKRAGREFKGLSPFKVEKTPSFIVNDHEGLLSLLRLRRARRHLHVPDEDRGLVVPRGGRAAGRRGRRADAEARRAR